MMLVKTACKLYPKYLLQKAEIQSGKLISAKTEIKCSVTSSPVSESSREIVHSNKLSQHYRAILPNRAISKNVKAHDCIATFTIINWSYHHQIIATMCQLDHFGMTKSGKQKSYSSIICWYYWF